MIHQKQNPLKVISGNALNQISTRDRKVQDQGQGWKREPDYNSKKFGSKQAPSYESNKDNDQSITSSIFTAGGFYSQMPQRMMARTIDLSKIVMVNDDPYLIISKIGKGGSSKVYKVLSPDGSVSALKVVDLSNASPEAVECFVNEIHLLKMLQGPDRIITLINSQVDTENKKISIVLELGDIDLRSLIEKNRQADKTVNPNFLRLMWQQMLEAVQIVHEHNVVHGDLKPANFLFVKGTLKLIDFGIAKSINVDTTNIERTHQVGTLNYMCPELFQKNEAKGTFKVGRAADVWSLGCILYQLVYNDCPFPQLDVFSKIQAISDPNYQIEFNNLKNHPDFADLYDVMSSCLQRDPKQRPTIEELLQHSYIYMAKKDMSSLINQVSDKLLSIINFIQDYEYIVDSDEILDNAVFEIFAKDLLDSNKDDVDIKSVVKMVRAHLKRKELNLI